jgi:hypothetical protein
MSNYIEESLASLAVVSNLTNQRWIEEINSDGQEFNYDSQDIYRVHLELVYSLNFNEKIKSNSTSFFKDLADKNMPDILKRNIELYESFSNIFDCYDRTKLQIEFYRKLSKSNKNDEDLSIEIMQFTELMNREEYLKSDFYKDFGFLTTNFHYYIYQFNKRLLKDFESNFENYSKYNSDFIFVNKTEIFPMEIILKLHQVTNNELYENIKITNFYDELNFFHSVKKIKIKPKQNNKVYYVIYKLSCLINDKELKNNWLDAILYNFQLKKSNYSSKYINVKQVDSLTDFMTNIDDIITLETK